MQRSGFVQKNPAFIEDLERTLEIMAEDVFDKHLKARKLKGGLSDSWSCSAGHDVRILFRLAQHEGSEAILLQTVGTHDEVY